MPEGHTIHRIAKHFNKNFTNKNCVFLSPQGRFEQEAKLINKQKIVSTKAYAKHLFIELESGLYIHVHLGLYGAWNFYGSIQQPNEFVNYSSMTIDDLPEKNEFSLRSMGAPRINRKINISEKEKSEFLHEDFPPKARDSVRLRILSNDVLADLTGPTKCKLVSFQEVSNFIKKLGPDPASHLNIENNSEKHFIRKASKSLRPIAVLLMDQTVIGGIGNIFRAEILFRLKINPYLSGNLLDNDTYKKIWVDWETLLNRAISYGVMLTRENGDNNIDYKLMIKDEDLRYSVYKRQGKNCYLCGYQIKMDIIASRKLYWCVNCQK